MNGQLITEATGAVCAVAGVTVLGWTVAPTIGLGLGLLLVAAVLLLLGNVRVR